MAEMVSDSVYRQSKLHPHKLALYVAMGSMVMLFVAWSSAYVVRQSAGNWLEFPLPSMFYVSTAVILLSSVTLHLSYRSFLRGREMAYKGLLVATMILGLAFIHTQYQGWMQLFDQGIFLDGNPSGSFVYVISAAHVAHLLGGIAALVMALVHALALPFKPTAKRKIRFELTLTYWHFVDLLWVYLILFFLLQG